MMLRVREALNRALADELDSNPSVILLNEDIAAAARSPVEGTVESRLARVNDEVAIGAPFASIVSV